MSARAAARLAALLLLASAAARADIVLNGNQHTGATNSATFTPSDPVDCDKRRANPGNFHLSQSATITGFTMHDPIDLQSSTFTVDIDGTQRSAITCAACSLCTGTTSCADITVTLTTGVALGSGDHTVAVVDPSGASGNCLASNDFGFSKLTLLSTATTTSIMLNQKRHIGDTNDTNDDYDTTDTANPFYPDNFEGDPITQSFTLGAGRRLTDVMLYRLRDLDTSDAAVKIDGTSIGVLANTGDPYETNPTTVSTSLLLASGTHTVTVDAGDLGFLSIDDFSWDDIILRFSSTGSSGTVGFFNAVDIGDPALTGSIRTKTAGAAFTLSLYALNGFGTGQATTYTGTATVDVLNASNNSGTIDVYGCNSSWTSAQSLGAVTFVAGAAVVAGSFLDAGLKEARIRVTDSTTGAAGCSVDNFAIRPASFSVAPSHATETTAGTASALTNGGTSGLPQHRAGQPFTITATARSAGGVAVSNYDGTPDVSATALSPATVNGTVTVSAWGSSSGGVRSTDTARYTEVGPMTLKLEDTTWAAVDADDTAANVRSFSGTATTGRFIPDHFKVVEGTLSPACAGGGFSYLGAALAWATPAVTLTAVNASNATTLNYQGSLEKLPDTLAQPAYAALTGTLNTTGLSAPTFSTPTAGVSTIVLPSLSFTRALIGAFDAEIRIDLPTFADTDGIVPEESPIVLGALSAGSGVAFNPTTAKSQRFGRLYFEPKYGSERLPMDVELRAEYFDGFTFRHNTADTCTSISAADVTLTPVGGQTHTVTANGAGRWRVTLTAPNTPGQATLGVDLASPPVTPAVPYPLLQADADGNGTYAEDAAGSATFGLFSKDTRWIYQREVVGN